MMYVATINSVLIYIVHYMTRIIYGCRLMNTAGCFKNEVLKI